MRVEFDGELRGENRLGWVGKLGGFCRERNGYFFQNENGRDRKVNEKGLKWFLRKAKMFRGLRT